MSEETRLDPRILTKLEVEHVEGTMFWLVLSPFHFQSEILNRVVVVPAGFMTDFNSVPRPLWSILPPHENPEAGVVHDWLYKYNGCTKNQADRVHREVFEVIDRVHPDKAPRWKRVAMYTGLVLGGSRTWNRYRREQIARELDEATDKLAAIESALDKPAPN
jgi:uncharacterized protein DUF1353